MAEAIALAKELNETNSLAVALHFAAFLARYEHNPAEVERLASVNTSRLTAGNRLRRRDSDNAARWVGGRKGISRY
jgi:hypothetical protein